MKTIILTGGGTAGHITPNLALLPALKEQYQNIIYIGSGQHLETDLLKNYPYVKYHSVPTIKFKRAFSFENLKIPFVLFKGIKEAKKIIKQYNPDVIFSKGGYVALPVVLAGAKLKVPMVAHESDLTLGLANKLVKNKFKTICTTFKQTAEKLKNGVYTGAPLTQQIMHNNPQNFKKQFNITSNKPILLVLGGSQGALQINQLIENNLEVLTKDYYIVHICGKDKLNKNISNPNYLQLEFYNNMGCLYACTSLCITRGGSNTIFELLYNHIPMLIIPLQNGSRGDQVANAKYFEKHNYALALYKKEITNADFLTMYNTLKQRQKLIMYSTKDIQPENTIFKIIKEINAAANKKTR